MLISADTGGTFTDFVYSDNGLLKIEKRLSTPAGPEKAVLNGVRSIAGSKEVKLIHGSTVATNAVLERKGARTAVITNRGFEDVIEIGRQNRPELYNLDVKRPPNLIPAKHRYGVPGRISRTGDVVVPFDESAAIHIVKQMNEAGIISVAVCFLFSFVNPAHELKMKAILEAHGKQPLFISLSHQIMSEFREFERTSTTVVNAYVQPVMRQYISRIESAIGGENLSIMQSNGGRITSKTAEKEPVRTILSGPAGGVVGAFEIARLAGYNAIITFDMGGTSTDVSLVRGQLPVNVESTVSNYPLKVPMIEIHTVGAGGGSIAYLDNGGALKVGPRSAGADPGPICYGRGNEITVTDANLFLGRLVPGHFLGGDMQLSPERLKRHFSALGKKAGLNPQNLANGIFEIANTVMERAVRVISVDRGHDPADFILVSFGGAGGLHAAFLAGLLNIPRVLIPKDPGILSAKGMLLSDVIKDYSRTVMYGGERSYEELSREFDTLRQTAVEEMLNEGLEREKITLIPLVDMRYRGQSYELIVPFNRDFRNEFHQAHEKRYGYANRTGELEIVNLRLSAVGKTEKPAIKKKPGFSEQPDERVILEKVNVTFDESTIPTPVIDRKELRPGHAINGPAIIVEYSSTIVIPPLMSAGVDPFENIIIETKER